MKAKLFLAIGAAVVLATAFFLLNQPQPKDTAGLSLPEMAPRAVTLSDTALDAIDRVVITPSAGEAYTLLVRDGSVKLAGKEDFDLRASFVSDVVNNICHVQAERVILDMAEKPIRLSDFGLDPCAFSAEILYRDQHRDLIRIGNQIAGDEIPWFYFLWNDDMRLFAGGTDMASAFNTDLSYLRAVSQPDIHRDLLERIEITGQENLVLSLTDFGWRLESPVSYPASSTFMEGFLKNVSQFMFSRFLGTETEFDPAVTGLDAPALTLTLTEGESIVTAPDTKGDVHTFIMPKRELRFAFGNAYDSSSYYASYDGKTYTVSYLFYRILSSCSADEMRQLNPFLLELYQVERIVLVSSEGSVTECGLSFQETQSQASQTDDVLYDLSVSVNNHAVDTEAFQRWYQDALYSFLPDGALPLPVSDDAEAKLTVTVENAYAKRTVEFIPYDTLHMAVRVDGVALDYVSNTACEKILALNGL